MNNRSTRSLSLLRPISRVALAAGLCALPSCHKPAANSAAGGQNPAPDNSVLHSPADARRQPSTGELTNFLRTQMPPAVRVVDVKNDPPVSLPNTLPGTHAWLLNVRLTFASAEDQFEPAAALDVQALQTLLEELHGLDDWSQSYARSPYTDLGPGFTVHVPAPAAPQLLVLTHPKDRPFAPIYGKVAAEWQVDHWQFTVLDLQMPDDASKPRGAFTGPTLVQHSPEAERFLATAKAALSEAKTSQATIERRYQEALAQATRPGTVYHGELRLLSTSPPNPVPVEVRFVDVTLGDPAPHQAQFTLKLMQPPTGHEYAFRAELAEHLPLVPPGQTHQSIGYKAASLGDASIDFAQATGKEDQSMSLGGLLFRAMHSGLNAGNLQLFVHNRRLEGWVASGYYGQLLISAGQAP